MPFYQLEEWCCNKLAERSYYLWTDSYGVTDIQDREGFNIMEDIKYCPYCRKRLDSLGVKIKD